MKQKKDEFGYDLLDSSLRKIFFQEQERKSPNAWCFIKDGDLVFKTKNEDGSVTIRKAPTKDKREGFWKHD